MHGNPLCCGAGSSLSYLLHCHHVVVLFKSKAILIQREIRSRCITHRVCWIFACFLLPKMGGCGTAWGGHVLCWWECLSVTFSSEDPFFTNYGAPLCTQLEIVIASSIYKMDPDKKHSRVGAFLLEDGSRSLRQCCLLPRAYMRLRASAQAPIHSYQCHEELRSRSHKTDSETKHRFPLLPDCLGLLWCPSAWVSA